MSPTRKIVLPEPLERLAKDVPERHPNVRSLARFAANSECSLASVGFAAAVDFDHLLEGTPFEPPFGQSPFTFGRGENFENLLRAKDYEPLRTVIGDALSGTARPDQVENLRVGFPPTRAGMAERAKATRELVAKVLRGDADAPRLIDGAVLEREIGGVPAFFEADTVAARFDGPIHAGEIKSFPTVDGRADADKVGAAISQVSIYIVLLEQLVRSLGGKPDLVSKDALLITPLNTGLKPTIATLSVGREVDRAARILDQAPDARKIAQRIPTGLPTFKSIASKDRSVAERVADAEVLAERVGTRYRTGCLASCGLARFCRSRAEESDDPARLGGQVERLLPEVKTLERATRLAQGEEPSEGEAAVSRSLREAMRGLSEARRPRRRGRGRG